MGFNTFQLNGDLKSAIRNKALESQGHLQYSLPPITFYTNSTISFWNENVLCKLFVHGSETTVTILALQTSLEKKKGPCVY
jgi:hypothetical protein